MICQNCGNELPEGSNICLNCGFETVAPAPVQEKAADVPGKTLGLVSMILGIVSIACCNLLGLVSIAGLITGILSSKQAKAAGLKNNQSLAGIICSIIGLVLFIVGVIFCIIYFIGMGVASSSYYY
ncbi:MAG: zinc-ribbon domain-containing protein [Ruminococcaceae bacterium]|nr:zinc-ribbon domain-containing protein [Oscillospiraceae bacterium]